MIHQTKSSTPVSDDEDWTAANVRSGRTKYEWHDLLQKNERYHVARPSTGHGENEIDIVGHQQSIAVPSREFDGLKQLLVVSLSSLMIIGGLCFVVWFLWTFVMGFASLDIYDLTDVIRGYR